MTGLMVVERTREHPRDIPWKRLWPDLQVDLLTVPEREVLAWVVLGRTRVEIAKTMGCHPNSVSQHLTAVRDRLDLPNYLSFSEWLLGQLTNRLLDAFDVVRETPR